MRLDGFSDFEEIGRGGFSKVFRARQLRPDRTVAIKVLDVGVRGRNERTAFERECDLSARLGEHPHALPVYEVGFDRHGHPYLVLPFCEGGSLNDRLARGERFDVAEAVRLIARVGSAISAAHAAGILHRDVKPANILVDGYGEPRLADFGLARVAEQAEGERSLVMYTPLYAAPEQRLDEPIDERTDQYGLAVTLFALLEGGPPQPVGGRSDGTVRLHSLLTDGPPPLRRPDAPTAVQEVVRRGMATSPADRFESVDAFTRALCVAAGTPQAWTSIPRTFDGAQTVVKNAAAPMVEPPRRRHWWPVAIAVSMSLIFILAAAVVTRPRSVNPPNSGGGTSSSVVGTTASSNAAPAPMVNVGPEYAPREPSLIEFGGAVTFSWLPPTATINGVASPGVPYFSVGGAAPMKPLPSEGNGSGSWSGVPPSDAGCFYAVAFYKLKTGRVSVPSKPFSSRGAECPDVAPSYVP